MGATPEFKQQLREAFQAMQIGQTFTFQRTFTEGDVALFCGVTGDYNPYHIDQAFAESTWFGKRIIPGLLTSSMITHIGGLLGFLATEMHFEYAEAVAIGDTITCTVTVQEKDEEKRLVFASATLVNQHGVEVLRARFSGFPSNIRLAR
ncbi:MAG TPA: MaoC family dehydratase [Ktedonobacteraceae bacterium]|nr:MaoC family dehydratase [Ktedonobacteraceae bacterium]